MSPAVAVVVDCCILVSLPIPESLVLRNRRHLLLAGGLCVLVPAAGCNVGQSCTLETEAMSMVAQVIEDGTNIRAEADFKTGDRGTDAIPVDLCAEDELTINGEEPTKTYKLDRIVYSVTDDVSKTQPEYTFRLHRSEKDEIVETTVSVPPAFQILTPVPDEMVSRSAAYTVTWDPPNPNPDPEGNPEAGMHIQLEEEIGGGACVVPTDSERDFKRPGGVLDPNDAGSFDIGANELDGELDGCDATLNLFRRTSGTYPDALDGGGFVEARLVRSVTFVSVP